MRTINPAISSVAKTGKDNIFLKQLKFEREEKSIFCLKMPAVYAFLSPREVKMTGYWSCSF